jgi:hypothetical protein
MVNAARSLQCYYWIITKVNKHYTNHVTPRKEKTPGIYM